MNKKEFIEKRKWRYFWSQKFKEVGTFLLILTLSISSCYFVGKFGIEVLEIIDLTKIDTIWRLPLYLLIGFEIIIGFGAILFILILIFVEAFQSTKKWIENNMEKAVKRAEEDFVKEGIKDE
jgi:hypothetical protein